MSDTRLLELLIEAWQGLAARARERAVTASEIDTPPADYWYGIAFTFEMTATQLLTALVEMGAANGERDLPEPAAELALTSATTDGETEQSAQGSVNKRAQKLLEVLRAHPGEWLKRVDIAHGLGNKTLSSSDTVLLQFLADSGYIEMSSVETYAPSGHRWQYRAVEKRD